MGDSNTIVVPMQPRIASVTIEVPVINNGPQQVFFPDVQQLRGNASMDVITREISYINAVLLAFGPTNGLTTVTLPEAAKWVLYLYCEGWEKAKGLPPAILQSIPGNSPWHRQNFDSWKNIDWKKSYLQTVSGQAAAGAPYTFIFDVNYVRYNTTTGEEILGAQ